MGMAGRCGGGTAIVAWMALLGGCATYEGVVLPTTSRSILSVDLAEVADADIDLYLRAQATLEFPTRIAVARLDRVLEYA